RRQCMAGPIRTAIVKLCSANNTTKRESVFSASTIPRPSLKKSLLLLRSNSRFFLFGDDEKRTGCCRNMFSILLKDISFQYHRMSATANHTCLCTYFLFISHCEIVDRQRRGYSCKSGIAFAVCQCAHRRNEQHRPNPSMANPHVNQD